MRNKIIFFGSSKYSVIVEKILYENFGLLLVVTIPDAIVGRKHTLTPSPVKKFALDHKLRLITAHKISQNLVDHIESYHADFCIVSDYRIILPKVLLSLPGSIFLNVHHSLLPKYRGPSPAPAAILSDDSVTGVSIIKMTEKVDSGDILAQSEYKLESIDTTESLLLTLNTVGGQLLIPVVKNVKQYLRNRKKQNDQEATYSSFIKRSDGYIDLQNPPSYSHIDKMIRAYYPWPNAWTFIMINDKQKILKLLPENRIQLEGKRSMPIKEFLNGYPNLETLVGKLFPLEMVH